MSGAEVSDTPSRQLHATRLRHARSRRPIPIHLGGSRGMMSGATTTRSAQRRSADSIASIAPQKAWLNLSWWFQVEPKLVGLRRCG